MSNIFLQMVGWGTNGRVKNVFLLCVNVLGMVCPNQPILISCVGLLLSVARSNLLILMANIILGWLNNSSESYWTGIFLTITLCVGVNGSLLINLTGLPDRVLMLARVKNASRVLEVIW